MNVLLLRCDIVTGKIKKMIDTIIEEKAKGNQTLVNVTRTKLILKGINPDKFDANSEDNPEIIAKLRTLASELGVKV